MLCSAFLGILDNNGLQGYPSHFAMILRSNPNAERMPWYSHVQNIAVSYIYIFISPLQTINSFPGTDTDNTNRRLLSPVQWCAHIFDLGAQAGHRVGISKALISARQAFTPCAHLLPVLFLTYSYVRLKAV